MSMRSMGDGIVARTCAMLWGIGCLASPVACRDTTGAADTTGASDTTGATDTTGASDTTGPSQAELDCASQYTEFHARAVRDCECRQATGIEFGFCASDDGPERWECVCGFAAPDPANAEVLACHARAEVEFTACFVAQPCDDSVVKMACDSTYFLAVEACGQLSRESQVKFAVACFESRNFRCRSGEWVPRWALCDMFSDCEDGSDEYAELCVFTCSDGATIEGLSVCNGTLDCMDGSDEADCAFICADGEPIPREMRCDSIPDCKDMSDESGCM